MPTSKIYGCFLYRDVTDPNVDGCSFPPETGKLVEMIKGCTTEKNKPRKYWWEIAAEYELGDHPAIFVGRGDAVVRVI